MLRFVGKVMLPCAALLGLESTALFGAASNSPPTEGAPKVVILGGGYAGGALSHALQKQYDVTLVDTKPHFHNIMANPMVAAQGSDDNFMAHLTYSPHATVVVDSVPSISEDDLHSQIVTTANGLQLPYDVLVVATGSRTAVAFENAVDVRDQMACIKAFSALEKSQNVAVVGAGPAGVELATELAEAYPEKQIHMVCGSGLLRSYNDSAALETLRVLEATTNISLYQVSAAGV